MDYFTPASPAEAVAILGRYGGQARLLAGGTDLTIKLRDRSLAPRALVDIGRMEVLRGLRVEGDRLRIGPASTYSELAADPRLTRRAPLLASAMATIGCPQIRAKATIGGNVMNASPVADSVPPLLALDAVAHVLGPGGLRSLPLDEIFLGPQRTSLAPDELLVELECDSQEPDELHFFRKLGQRRALIIAKLSVAFRAGRRDGRLAGVRVALGAVAPRVIRARRTEARLEGSELDEEAIRAASELAAAEASPISDVRSSAEYRRAMVAALMVQGLTEARQ